MPICLILCFAGLAILWWTRKQKLGKSLVSAGVLLLSASSYSPITDIVLRPLEYKYPAYAKNLGEPTKYVVVLGGGHNTDPAVPITSSLSNESLKRLVEGIRVLRDNPGSKLILSGGSWHDEKTEAEVMAEAAKCIGVAETDIILEKRSKDTYDQAQLIAKIVNTNRIVLVTSASHLPRAVAMFERQGLLVTPAPTQHMVQRRAFEPELFLPSGRNLNWMEQAFHEYVGLAWAWLRGQT